MLRASPRRATIPARSSQRLKIAVRGLRKKPDGELVSYLSLTCKEKSPKTAATGFTFLPRYVYHLPVIVRKGELNAKLKITDAKLVASKNNSAVEFMFQHSGTRSLYGNIKVLDSDGSKIGEAIGYSIYQESVIQPFKINLKEKINGKKSIYKNFWMSNE